MTSEYDTAKYVWDDIMEFEDELFRKYKVNMIEVA